MFFTPRQKRILLQIIPFGVIPFIFSIIYTLIEKGILGDHPVYPSTPNPYNFQLIVPALATMVIGLIMGLFEVLYLDRWFQDRSFLKKIISKSIIYLSIVVMALMIIVILSNAFELGLSPFNKEVVNYALTFLSDFAFWTILLYFAMAIVLCMFYSEVSDNIGQAVLLNFLKGKYHHPIEEERIFMFLDMKSSTTIAERLGHVTYFNMLRDYYQDLSNPIIDYGGEIYQYVGDEMVITWSFNPGREANVLGCFYAMKKALVVNQAKYQSRYGLVPSFKAGVHLGTVTTGEIGVIKKEITFSGDVLNTAARIQGMCNDYEVDILVSEDFIEAMGQDFHYHHSALDQVTLRGRNEQIRLYTVIQRS